MKLMAVGAALVAGLSVSACGTSNAVPSWFDDNPRSVTFLQQLGDAGADVSDKAADEKLISEATQVCTAVQRQHMRVSQVEAAVKESGVHQLVPFRVLVSAAPAKGSLCPGIATA